MERDPDIARHQASSDADRLADENAGFDLSHLPPCPGLPSTDAEVAAADARAEADGAAGRTHSHALVGEWLATWGRPGRKPFKDWLAARHD